MLTTEKVLTAQQKATNQAIVDGQMESIAELSAMMVNTADLLLAHVKSLCAVSPVVGANATVALSETMDELVTTGYREMSADIYIESLRAKLERTVEMETYEEYRAKSPELSEGDAQLSFRINEAVAASVHAALIATNREG